MNYNIYQSVLIGFASGFVASIIADKIRGYYNLRRSFKKGFKQGYEMGLNQNGIVVKNFHDTEFGVRGDCFVSVLAHYPPEELM